MFKTIFSGHNKIWGENNLVGHCPRMPPRRYGSDWDDRSYMMLGKLLSSI